MRYPASEKLEIIRIVEQSHLPVRRTLDLSQLWSGQRTVRTSNLAARELPSCGGVSCKMLDTEA